MGSGLINAIGGTASKPVLPPVVPAVTAPLSVPVIAPASSTPLQSTLLANALVPTLTAPIVNALSPLAEVVLPVVVPVPSPAPDPAPAPAPNPDPNPPTATDPAPAPAADPDPAPEAAPDPVIASDPAPAASASPASAPVPQDDAAAPDTSMVDLYLAAMIAANSAPGALVDAKPQPAPPAPANVDKPTARSAAQVMAQAAYAMVADAHARRQSMLDLLKPLTSDQQQPGDDAPRPDKVAKAAPADSDTAVAA